jgi:phosphatidate cytidylyltransferase
LAKEFFSNILLRLPSAIVLAAGVFGILYLQNLVILSLLIALVAVFLGYEWLQISSTKIHLKQIIFLIAPVVLFVCIGETFINYFLFVSFGFWCIYGLLLITKNSGHVEFFSFNNNYLGIFLIQAFLFSLISILQFSSDSVNNFFVLFLLLFITALIDVAAYLVGSSIGRTPLFQDLSPNKTLEGFIGSVIVTILFIFLINRMELIQWNLFLLLIAVIPFAFIGDYFESQLKRKQQIKDSGSLIPGHGGIWDRLDSHMAIIPVFAALSSLLL